MRKMRTYSVKQLMEMQDELNSLIIPDWTNQLIPENFQVAIFDEFAELLGSGIDWKHWKYTDPEKFDAFNVKVEVVDFAFFYLSIMIMWNGVDVPQVEEEHIGSVETGSGIFFGNRLDHKRFMELQSSLLRDSQHDSIYYCIDVLNDLVTSVDMDEEEFSAFYCGKKVINEFRSSNGYKDGTYVKVQDGLEDNQRMEFLIKDFLNNSSMTLDDLRQNVEDAFFEKS